MMAHFRFELTKRFAEDCEAFLPTFNDVDAEPIL